MTLDVSNKISSIHTVLRSSAESDHPSAKVKVAPLQQPVTSQSVSHSSVMLDEAFQLMTQKSDIDLAKVQAVQTALAAGDLKLDEDALVQAIWEMHK